MTKKSTGEFLSFVSDVAQVVAKHVATPESAAPTVPSPPIDDFFLDDEKVIWDWPDVGGRVIEELR